MKRDRNFHAVRVKSGFTLIEMIGVMAILTIMAAVLTPNVLHSVERAAVKAEADNLHTLGQEIGYYLRDNNGAWPTSSPSLGWTTQLATYSSLNSADIQTNRRLMNRLYVADIANRRALLISSMRNGVALPTAANVTANFQGIWDTADGNVPPGAGWGGWTSGAGGNIEYLVIERVSLASVFQNDLQTYTMVINNSTATPLSYKTIPAVGSPSGVTPIPANVVGMTIPLKPRDRLNLYSDLSGTTLNFVYVVSNTPKTFTFTTSWVAQ
jgi:prepilin-type N-terminal cleavage/methylation domain-containing protein